MRRRNGIALAAALSVGMMLSSGAGYVVLAAGLESVTEEAQSEPQEQGIDYMALVNKLHPLPDGWEDNLETVVLENSLGDEVEVEAKAYEAYEQLRKDLEENNGIYIELDSARRSIAAQQDIMDRFTEKYGADLYIEGMTI